MKEKILKILEQNSRLYTSDISKMLDLDESEVIRLMGELEADKVICGYHTMIDWDKVADEMVTALIEVKVTPQREQGFDKLAERVRNFEEVNAVYLIAGAYDFIIILSSFFENYYVSRVTIVYNYYVSRVILVYN